MADPRGLARLLLPLLDLGDPAATDEVAVLRLCAAARTPCGPVASVAVPVAFAEPARAALRHSTVGVAIPVADAAEAAVAGAAAADEIEFEFPEAVFLAGDAAAAAAALRSVAEVCRRAPGVRPLFKVVIETGRLGDAATVRRTAALAIEAGADLLTTASGRREPGGSVPGTEAVLAEIVAARGRRRWAGLKLGGPLRSLVEAEAYLRLVERRLGPDFISPGNLRLDGSVLLDEILSVLAA